MCSGSRKTPRSGNGAKNAANGWPSLLGDGEMERLKTLRRAGRSLAGIRGVFFCLVEIGLEGCGPMYYTSTVLQIVECPK